MKKFFSALMAALMLTALPTVAFASESDIEISAEFLDFNGETHELYLDADNLSKTKPQSFTVYLFTEIKGDGGYDISVASAKEKVWASVNQVHMLYLEELEAESFEDMCVAIPATNLKGNSVKFYYGIKMGKQSNLDTLGDKFLEQYENVTGKNDFFSKLGISNPKEMTVSLENYYEKYSDVLLPKAVLTVGSKNYKKLVDGEYAQATLDVAPMVQNGKTMLPARTIAELLGVDVSYDAATKTATFSYGEGNKVEMTLGSKTIKVNGKSSEMSTAVIQVNGRVLLPLRDAQEALKSLGLTVGVEWNQATKEISII